MLKRIQEAIDKGIIDRDATGLVASVFRANRPDCTAGGVSSEVDKFYVFNGANLTKGERIERGCWKLSEITNLDMFWQILVLVDSAGNKNENHAVPLGDLMSGKWTMFGGNFVYTSDSRFSDHPVKIHDRVESGNK